MEFSADRDKWGNHLARRQHRSLQTGGKTSLTKQSYQRRDQLFGPPASSATVEHNLPTEASRDHWTEEQTKAVLPGRQHRQKAPPPAPRSTQHWTCSTRSIICSTGESCYSLQYGEHLPPLGAISVLTTPIKDMFSFLLACSGS